VAEVIKEIQQYQQTPYNLTPVPQIQSFFLNSESMEEPEAFKLSLQIEPREQ
jgi:son of sevenless-like protein